MNGVLVINKPEGYTSFDIVAVIRRLSGQRRAGHTGTLDPNATGVLPVLLGYATKAQDLILNQDKKYIAEFALGITTDTLDIWGKTTSKNASAVSKSEIESVMQCFVGEIEQIPPMFSAVQKNGQRLYDLARKGIEVERESRRVKVYSLKLLDFDEAEQSGKFEISCSKGTYVRSIIDDIGKMLGVGAVMTSLCRTSACGFVLKDCITLEQAEELARNGQLDSRVKSVESLFYTCDSIHISDAQAKRFSNGGALDLSRTSLRNLGVENGIIYRVKNRADDFLGLGITDTVSQTLKIYLNIPQM